MILEAVQAYFLFNDDNKLNGFGDYEGKIIRGNQRRGHIHRKK